MNVFRNSPEALLITIFFPKHHFTLKIAIKKKKKVVLHVLKVLLGVASSVPNIVKELLIIY